MVYDEKLTASLSLKDAVGMISNMIEHLNSIKSPVEPKDLELIYLIFMQQGHDGVPISDEEIVKDVTMWIESRGFYA
jgi:hypothetical protein